MGRLKHSAGFTIIEVMLFLAVSGALAVGVLATATVGINNQRYQDAVNSFKAMVQEEFVNTTRVINARSGVASCPVGGGSPTIPGASECIVMGRLLTASASGEVVRSNIIGRPSADTDTAESDIDTIRSYDVDIDTLSQQKGEMNWGTTPFRTSGGQAVSVVILRSSMTGNVLAFVQYGIVIDTQQALKEFISDEDGNGDFTNTSARLICVDPAGWTVAQRQGVVITPYAANPAAVEQRVVEVDECV